MFRQLRIATLLLVALTMLTGGVYPLIVTAVAQLAFPQQANGSLLKKADQTIGSSLIGQQFTKPEYFWGRLSATAPYAYNATASSGSNYGPLHPDLKKAAEARIELLTASGSSKTNIPADLVTASGSGLDPQISLAAAEFQVARVAAVRKMKEESVRELVRQNTEGRQLGVLGEPRVNVLALNLALDHSQKKD
ncbi:potassium-transporting ATPase subunit KdpC [Anatilimnocola floriformis]|uniref:potassium-transporting ATPase subunit KdpC n=1 Tax=Anatilimnocola floriformis TaxID=2948575 RepID=UPI0020C559A1|nr:potassium-transporting ATPase subunit KdpC [Anatilimnocola floriformis]